MDIEESANNRPLLKDHIDIEDPVSQRSDFGAASDEASPFLTKEKSSIRDELVEHREPLTHLKNKTFTEKYFNSCIDEAKTRLSPEELRNFYTLRFDCNIPFSKENDQHNKMLSSLWFAAFNSPMDSEIPNKRWKEIGFQNIDPRTDFRGGGLTSLKVFTHYAENYPHMVKKMTDPNDDFVLAISSIYVTYYLIKYFHLADFLVYEKDRKDLCSRKALKNFCRFLKKDPEVLYKFHDILLTDLYVVWTDLKKIKQNVTILDFGFCQAEMKAKLQRCMAGVTYKSFEEFQAKYSAAPNWVTKPNFYNGTNL